MEQMIYKGTTIEQFEDLINKFGWTIKKTNNNLNRFLINEKGNKTNIYCYSDRIEIKKFDLVIGGSEGTLVMYFQDMDIELSIEDECNTLSFGKLRSNIFIQLYNFKNT